ncbi:putative 2-aminoethylphosphonate ABC transporter substrate-binding protein [Aestuariirhabdus sp. Z084]|uniref:putative 2-aminoethylphosphonate ABC transporter substrate-binding protein n=1 Tax=Aestuariirhabdus haliotis TaxID=2918751 RepID=UPI00201B37E9|nr:putative 2-aminoethylphosphonate ABC transporter substrate-binding protein [Aestuariirhabdus haliotis]MCL6416941.1 putative 2-aminoethylphosphonate ABC transporter substrate-binding protein [Aestuariirhabdus haliotis]MCL6420956.1 putative 2-aminoethylphosphonate ABC transporter substrate-binding protein [Aestuariirhabdus haliotis]
MKLIAKARMLAAVLSVGTVLQAQAQTELTVYTALEADQLKAYANAFQKEHSDIRIRWVRDSTGIVTARLLAEKENPQADVVLGLAATSLLVLKDQGMLQGYKPAGVEKLSKKFVDKGEQPTWVGMDAWVASICYNTIEAKKLNLPKPTSWKDLTRPEYKGHVIMPNPNSSGTGFLDVSSWLQSFGEGQGWAYMDKLHGNIDRYTHSGSKPCKLAAAGETAIGVSFAYRGAKLVNKGAPIEVIFPVEGLGWDMEAAAIVKGTDKLKAAQTLMDWAVSRKANELYSNSYAVVAMPGVAKPIKNYPEDIADRMIDNDFEWSAVNRSRILKEWQQRYDSKSEPKK